MTDAGKIEILIVEDSYPIARLIEASVAALAARRGLACEFVHSHAARAARLHLAARPFDAVVLDLNLGDAEPGESLMAATRGARVVVLSGVDDLLDGARLAAVRKLAPAAILPKPTAWPEVAAAVLAPWLQPTPTPTEAPR